MCKGHCEQLEAPYLFRNFSWEEKNGNLHHQSTALGSWAREYCLLLQNVEHHVRPACQHSWACIMRQYKSMQLIAKVSEDSNLDLPLRFQQMDTRCQKSMYHRVAHKHSNHEGCPNISMRRTTALPPLNLWPEASRIHWCANIAKLSKLKLVSVLPRSATEPSISFVHSSRLPGRGKDMPFQFWQTKAAWVVGRLLLCAASTGQYTWFVPMPPGKGSGPPGYCEHVCLWWGRLAEYWWTASTSVASIVANCLTTCWCWSSSQDTYPGKLAESAQGMCSVAEAGVAKGPELLTFPARGDAWWPSSFRSSATLIDFKGCSN